MKVGVLKEIKAQEYRVGLTPAGARELVRAGHEVVVEYSAGEQIGFSDELYRQAGCQIMDNAAAVFDAAELLLKVKEPQAEEIKMLRENHILFTFLHLAPDTKQCEGLLASGVTGVAYETVTSPHGGLPLLAPMSEIAGRLSVQAGARCLEKSMGGSGLLLGGVPGVEPAKVLVLGGGVVGVNAARIAMGTGAQVTIVDKNIDRLRWLDNQYGPHLKTLFSTEESIAESLKISDLVIGAVLIPGAAAPKLVREEHLKLMQPGSVLVDVAIDQGGCFATSKATTHQDPTYIKEDIVHYCVANMPGAVARTSTMALTNATLPYVLALANNGRRGLLDMPGFLEGLNVINGKLCCKAVAQAQDKLWTDPKEILA